MQSLLGWGTNDPALPNLCDDLLQDLDSHRALSMGRAILIGSLPAGHGTVQARSRRGLQSHEPGTGPRTCSRQLYRAFNQYRQVSAAPLGFTELAATTGLIGVYLAHQHDESILRRARLRVGLVLVLDCELCRRRAFSVGSAAAAAFKLIDVAGLLRSNPARVPRIEVRENRGGRAFLHDSLRLLSDAHHALRTLR